MYVCMCFIQLVLWIQQPLCFIFLLTMQCERANPCFAPYLCHDKVVGYSCAACPMGYSGGGTSGSSLQDAISKKTGL